MGIYMRYPGGKAKALTLSYDDGVVQDIRLIGIMNKYGLKGTFNLNSGLFTDEDKKEGESGRISVRQAVELYSDSGHEVAVHTKTHPHLEELSPAMITQEIMQDREWLEEKFGGFVQGMAYPFGTYNDEVIECMKACGIVYSRAVRPTEAFKLPVDWMRLEPTCHHNHPKLPDLTKKFIEGKHRPCDVSWLFYVWGHSYEFDNCDNWEVFENFAKEVSCRDDVWYATNIEIYDYVQAYKQLIVNASGTEIYNPTSTDIWICSDGKDIEVKAGSRTRI